MFFSKATTTIGRKHKGQAHLVHMATRTIENTQYARTHSKHKGIGTGLAVVGAIFRQNGCYSIENKGLLVLAIACTHCVKNIINVSTNSWAGGNNIR